MSRLPELPEGKMFGVLVVQDSHGKLGYLLAYSGQTDVFKGRQGLNEDDFVPAVFDYLAPGGYFKRHEAEITALNHQIAKAETAQEYTRTKALLKAKNDEFIAENERRRNQLAEAKRLRDERRSQGSMTEEEEQALIKESQFLKAELRRWKKRCQEELLTLQEAVAGFDAQIKAMKTERKTLSDRLQRWLFDAFRVADSHGAERSLSSIFAESIGVLPPSGAGECCEPKLLHFAFTHQLRPLTMAMFWWGPSPACEVRTQGNYYPACQGKCKPLLTWMLRDMDVEPNPLDKISMKPLKIVYEDAQIAVINKPAGMLSVPGKGNRPSVFSIMNERWPDAEGPVIVHRLDMDTSGLMVVARTKEAHRHLQQQFEQRQTEKTYVALLEHEIPMKSGKIALPLRPDIEDRPRQLVDTAYGKPALTLYNIIGTREGHAIAELQPKTGRTHQLRVHCAHQQGLCNPIVGDRMYGHTAERLCLHAAKLTFAHPVTGERMTFEARADFLSIPSQRA